MSATADARGARGARLRRIAAVAIGGLVAVRAVILFVPQAWFDVDPARDPSPIGGLGAPGDLLLNVLLLVACGIGCLGLGLGGRLGRGAWWWLLALPGVLVLFAHAIGDLEQLRAAATWIAALAAGATAWGLAGEGPARRWLVALVLAALVPVLARSALQVEIGPWTGGEHARTVAEWAQQRDAFLAERGWGPGDPAARIFERRLRQAQPRGWFVTTNVYATFAAAGMLLFAAAAWTAFRERAGGGAVLLAVVAAAGCAVGLVETGSKGAWGAAVLGMVAAGALVCAGGRLRMLVPWIGPAVLVLVPCAVIVRGTVLPEQFAGDLSLLFRWQYMEAAAGAVLERPLGGVGADGFAEAYLQHRTERSPEEVRSAHGVLADWMASMGATGIGWLLLLGAAAAAMGGAAFRRNADPANDVLRGTPEEEASPGAFVTIGTALLLGLGLTVVLFWIEPRLAGADEVLVRGLGGLGFGAGAMALIALRRRADDAAEGERGAAAQSPRAAFAGAARFDERRVWHAAWIGVGVILLSHAQIEMTAVRPGAAAWWTVLIGLAAAHGRGLWSSDEDARRAGSPAAATAAVPDARPRWRGVVPAAACLAVALAVLVVGMPPAMRAAAARADAARMLAPIAILDRAVAVATTPPQPSMLPYELGESVSVVLDEAAASPATAEQARGAIEALRAYDLRTAASAMLALRDAMHPSARRAAGTRLLDAADATPSVPRLRVDAADQLLRAAALAPESERSVILAQADAAVDPLIATGRALDVAIDVWEVTWRETGDPIALERARAIARDAIARDPAGVPPHRRLALLLTVGGDEADPAAAAEVARRALALDAAKSLDPLKQLPDDDRRELERIAAAAAAGDPDAVNPAAPSGAGSGGA